eukprot:1801191-Amphidinium_carterae.1
MLPQLRCVRSSRICRGIVADSSRICRAVADLSRICRAVAELSRVRCPSIGTVPVSRLVI